MPLNNEKDRTHQILFLVYNITNVFVLPLFLLSIVSLFTNKFIIYPFQKTEINKVCAISNGE